MGWTLSAEERARLEAAWERALALPDDGYRPDFDEEGESKWPTKEIADKHIVDIAFEGCMVYAGFDISVCDRDQQNQIFLATLDAVPRGIDEAQEAAAVQLRVIAQRDWKVLLP